MNFFFATIFFAAKPFATNFFRRKICSPQNFRRWRKICGEQSCGENSLGEIFWGEIIWGENPWGENFWGESDRSQRYTINYCQKLWINDILFEDNLQFLRTDRLQGLSSLSVARERRCFASRHNTARRDILPNTCRSDNSQAHPKQPLKRNFRKR